MKILGFIFISLGVALFLFTVYSFFQESNKLVSPIPEDHGVKVIFVTPAK